MITDSGPWAISIRTPKKSVIKVIPRESPQETLNEVLTRTKHYAKAIREKYKHRDDVIVEIISRKHVFQPPTDLKLRSGHLWCPYCAKQRRFRKGMLLEFDSISYVSDARCCEICTISENDYYVKDFNGLWPAGLSMAGSRKGK